MNELTATNPWLAAAGMGLGALSSFFSGRRESKEAEKNRQIQRDQLALQRQRFGLEREQYQDQLARLRARNEFMRPTIEAYRQGTGAFERTAPKLSGASIRGYLTGQEEG